MKDWEHTASMRLQAVLFTDCDSSVHALLRLVLRRIADKQLSIELAGIRQSIWRARGDKIGISAIKDELPLLENATDTVRWIDTDEVIAGCYEADGVLDRGTERKLPHAKLIFWSATIATLCVLQRQITTCGRRHKCRCQCGCIRRPGRLVQCCTCGAGVGPGCCLKQEYGDNGICHLCHMAQPPEEEADEASAARYSRDHQAGGAEAGRCVRADDTVPVHSD